MTPNEPQRKLFPEAPKTQLYYVVYRYANGYLHSMVLSLN